MRCLRSLVLIAAALAALAALAAPSIGQAQATSATAAVHTTAAAHATASLTWLAGCWRTQRGRQTVEEIWMAPRGGVLLGIGRTTVNDSLVEYESMRIFARDKALVFAATPMGQAPAEFVTAPLAGPGARATELVFANPGHDFPQRVRYRAVGSDSLIARVEGTVGGAARGVDFRYARVACGPG